MPQLLAVYGTLKKGEYNNSLLSTSVFVGNAEVPGELWTNMGENFPRASYDTTHGSSTIMVELYTVSPRIMNQLARLEIPYGYYPQVVKTTDGRYCIMWADVDGRNPNSTLIKNGNYKNSYEH